MKTIYNKKTGEKNISTKGGENKDGLESWCIR
jgi:hypothetical protein